MALAYFISVATYDIILYIGPLRSHCDTQQSDTLHIDTLHSDTRQSDKRLNYINVTLGIAAISIMILSS